MKPDFLGNNITKFIFGMTVLLCQVFFFSTDAYAEDNIFKDRIQLKLDTITDSGEQKIIAVEDSAKTEISPIVALENDSIRTDSLMMEEEGHVMTFNPDPTRAVWMSALFPGLGQVYNRRYWKLPIVVGGFMGISYALTWNNKMYSDYTHGYRDIMDNDPATKSYMEFFPSFVKEEDLDTEWLKKVLKSKKDYYRKNKELSVICMVGMYLLCMVDAYVDASLSHFDISPNISMDVAPTIMDTSKTGSPSIGVQWAISF